MIKRMRASGILPLFYKKQTYTIPSYVDQLYSNAISGHRKLANGKKIPCLTANVQGMDVTNYYMDIRNAYEFNVPGAEERVDQEIQDATASTTAEFPTLVD